MRSFTKYYLGDQIEEEEVGGGVAHEKEKRNS